jgi:hypothetical protein
MTVVGHFDAGEYNDNRWGISTRAHTQERPYAMPPAITTNTTIVIAAITMIVIV